MQKDASLAKTLGLGSVILLGISALLGGGIFTLLGHAAGLAGPALFISMIVGGVLAFVNLQTYLSLGLTFPGAGGGYQWVKKGLGHFWGFLTGWFSWFATLAAGSLYAASFGFYLTILMESIGLDFGNATKILTKVFAVGIIVLFGYLNWKGAKISSDFANKLTIILFLILISFIIFGFLKIAEFENPLQNFKPLLPNGILGIIGAVAFFYIAFEGSEIQVQTAEEVKNIRVLKKGLTISLISVISIYILISVVTMGASRFADESSWISLDRFGEGAITASAAQFLPFGGILMTIGGLLANLVALNAVLYSSSRVAFAMARDKSIWSRLAEIHLRNYTPYLTVILSTTLMVIMTSLFPISDIGGIASLLFILLFLQLNIAAINIYYKYPNTKWVYRIPFFPILPLVATAAYLILAATMLRVNINAWVIAIIWALLGVVNYLAYTEKISREEFETSVIFETSKKVGSKTGKRLLLTLDLEAPLEETKSKADIAFALTSQFNGELVILQFFEIPPTLSLHQSSIEGARIAHAESIFQRIDQWIAEYNKETGPAIRDINYHNLLMFGRNGADIILEVAKVEECDIILIPWEGYVRAKGAILGTSIDRLMREAKTDILVIKNPRPPKSILIPIALESENPYLGTLSEVAIGLKKFFKSKIEVFTVITRQYPPYLKPDVSHVLKNLPLPKNFIDSFRFIQAKSIITSILEESKNFDLILMSSRAPAFLKEIRFGTISEIIAKQFQNSVIIVKGHAGPTEVFWQKLLKILTGKKIAET